MSLKAGLILSILGLVPATAGFSAPEAGSRDGLAVQKARTAHGEGIKDKRFYSHEWDLGSLPAYVPKVHLTGTIRIAGNDVLTRGRLLEYWTADFKKFQPDVKLDFQLFSSAVAIPSLDTGVADIAIGRPLLWMERLGFERTFGYDPLEVDALNGAFDTLGWNPAWVIVVNKNNPMTRITFRQLDGIFGAERNGGWVGTTWHPEFARGAEGNIRTWDQAGLEGPWKGQAIHVYGMPLQYSPTYTFNEMVLKGSDKWNEHLMQFPQYVGADGKLVIGAQVLVGEIGKDAYGIGMSTLGYLTPDTKALAIAVDDQGPYITPTIETVQNRTYPFYCSNAFFVNRVPGQPLDPKVAEFLRFVLSREGQAAVVRDGKILPLTGQNAAAELKKLD